MGKEKKEGIINWVAIGWSLLFFVIYFVLLSLSNILVIKYAEANNFTYNLVAVLSFLAQSNYNPLFIVFPLITAFIDRKKVYTQVFFLAAFMVIIYTFFSYIKFCFILQLTQTTFQTFSMVCLSGVSFIPTILVYCGVAIGIYYLYLAIKKRVK